MRVIEGPHSRVEVKCIDGEYEAWKTYTAFQGYGVPFREAYWLERLNGLDDHAPRLLYFGYDQLRMTYCGRAYPEIGRNRQQNLRSPLPEDWKSQAYEVLARLLRRKCSHNDIRPENIMLKDDRLYLIDFGWATHVDELIPEIWPESIGSSYRKGVHDFDDEYSLFKSLEAIRDGKA